jgi:hypothetical protein
MMATFQSLIMTNTSKILACLPTLSKPDLAQIRAAADSLLGPGAAPNDSPATPLFDAITRALGLRLGWAEFQAGTTYKPYKRGERAIAEFLGSTFPSAADRVQFNAMLTFMIECLVDDLKERKVPLSLGALCVNLERCPEVFKAAFPGYIEGGAAHLILQRMKRGKT